MKKICKATLVFGILILNLTLSVNAQWECPYWFNIPVLEAVRFKDFNNGIAVGNKILRTNDNGTTWDTVFSDTTMYFEDVAYVDSVTILVVGSNQSNGIIAKSTDDGNTWNTITISNCLFSLSFPSENVGYAGGKNGILYKTTDKGNSWVPMSVGDPNPFNSVYFVNDTVGFIMADSVVLKTINGGNSWSITVLQPFYGFNNGHNISFPSDSIGYLNFQSHIYKTTDMGANWSLYGNTSAIDNYVFSLFFVNDTIGYLCGEFLVAKTIDGGLNWTQQSASPPSSYNFMDSEFDVYFLNQDTGFIVGVYTFYRTTIGGITGVNNYEAKRGLSLYPNPLIQSATISFDYKQNEKYLLRIYNMAGQKVMEKTDISSGQIRIDRKDMTNGLYFFQLQNSKGIIGGGKFIIE